ncbi:MAG: DUF4373 domain-containing protein [Bacteroidaceae bacterium]|nr:DUF4373 domain-containing protein [Bacteroidaceae bacterium]
MARSNIQEGEYYAADFFSHDKDMRNDIKIKALRRKFQFKGYAVWCFLLEAFTDSDDFEIEYGEIDKELLASDFDVPVEELTEIVEYSKKIGLLQEEDGKLFSMAQKRRFREAFDRTAKRREANRINGRKGGNPNFVKGQPNPYYNRESEGQEITQSVIQDNPNITQEITEDNPTIQDKTIQDKTDRKTPKGDKKKSATSRFVPPTPEQVRDYAQAKGYSIDPERFCDYYTSNGWRVGRNPMKDWQATVRQWAARDREQNLTAEQPKGSLGVGEFIDSQGRRTYGTSGQIVPADAPPRPTAAHWWSEASRQWEKMP